MFQFWESDSADLDTTPEDWNHGTELQPHDHQNYGNAFNKLLNRSPSICNAIANSLQLTITWLCIGGFEFALDGMLNVRASDVNDRKSAGKRGSSMYHTHLWER